MKKLYHAMLALLLAAPLFSQNHNPWKVANEQSFAKAGMDRRIVPDQYETFALDLQALGQILKDAPMRFSAAAKSKTPVLSIPIPGGKYQDFNFVEAPVMHPDLAAKFPDIKTYAGWSEADPTAYMRFGISPKGFHAMVLSAMHSTVYIDVYAEGETEHYISYFKKDFHRDEPFVCLADELPENQKPKTKGSLNKVAGDCQFRTYALALACTGEYATFHGGTKPLVMAAFNTAMARVNGIYERDFDLTMVMVPNNDQLIFLNANTDPYTNNSGGTMLGQNQTTCNSVIGSANYDIGHVFSTGGGGVASLNSTCSTNSKARGVTGLTNPIGDPFYVDYVSHEMGHQFGGRHTFNSNQGSCSGNQSNAAAVEPGSGTTIQAYAGICGSHNVQNNSDDYFHAFSLNEMGNHIAGSGGNCAVLTPNGNNAPTVTVPNTTYSMPIGTPFVLTAEGSDPDAGNVLTYCWEQMDNETATMPPTPNNTGGPAFRSLSPVVSPSRFFPNLNAVVNNINETWEVLPNVTRQMDFRCTARDNNPNGGCTDEVDVRLNFTSSAGPFLVTEPNSSAVVWNSNFTETVTWDVANTSGAPVNASTVDILLSVDGGYTYPFTLVTNTANDGSQQVLVPNVVSDQARVMVKANNHVFYDISNENFTIEIGSVPTFTVSAQPSAQTGCPGDEVGYVFDLLSFIGFNEAVNFSATGIPAGATAAFQPNLIIPPGTVSLIISGLENVAPGSYTIDVNAVAISVSQSIPLELTVLSEVSGAVSLTSPADGETGLSSVSTMLEWDGLPAAANYDVEVSLNPDFQVLVDGGNTIFHNFNLSNLTEGEVYYWRVRGANICNTGEYSPTYAFQVGGLACNTYESTDVPKSIPASGGGATISTLQVNDDFPIASIYLHTDITHTWIGDLQATITGPDGTSALLFDRPGDPQVTDGCEEDDMSVGFSDGAANTSDDLENACDPTPPAIDGDYQPIVPFSFFNGKSSMGAWTLSVSDLFPTIDNGSLDSWYMEMCGAVDFPAAVLLENNLLTVSQGQTENVTDDFLETQGAAAQTVYLVLSVPENGQLILQGLPLSVGGSFTQNDINNGFLSYTHDGSMTNSDDFIFDVVNEADQWLHNQTFQIEILENTIIASADLTEGLNCFGDANAVITVTASGGTDPLMYSINGGAAQSSNVFSGLAEGIYEVVVMDAVGLTLTTNSILIENPSAIIATTIVVDDDVTVNANGGTGMLQYSINGVDFQASNEFLNLVNGVYTLTVMDDNGCTETAEAIIAVNTLVVSASQTQDVNCFGGNEAEITVNVGGGTPDFMYSLDGVNFQSSNVFQNLTAGTYTVTVQDADGFVQTDVVFISEPTVITASATTNGYEINVAANGGTGLLQYGINGGVLQNSNLFYPFPAGSYDIVVQDANGCEVAISATVNVPALSVGLSISQTPTCAESSDGSLTANGQGGVPPFQFSLNGGVFQSSNIFNDLPAGDYTVTVMDSGGFTVGSSLETIVAPAPIMTSAISTANEITVMASGGTGTLMYQLDSGAFQASNFFTGVANGLHTVTVQDANGCEVMTDVLVNVPALGLVATVEQQVSCHDDMDGTISISASGGIPPYEYSLNGVDFQSGNTFANLAPGVYQPTIKDAIGQILASPNVTINNPDLVVAGGSAFGPVITASGMGGTGNFTYSFDNMPFQNDNEFEVLLNGVYEIVAMDENGCIDTTQVVVNKPEEIFLTILPPACFDSMDGEILIDGVDGGYAPYQFALNNGPLTSEVVYGGLGAGDYVFLVVDTTGYEWFTPSVTLDAPPPIVVGTTVVDNLLTINGSGGTGDLQFSIDGGLTFQSDSLFNNLPNGTYEVVVVDENGCTVTTTVVIDYTSANEVDGGLLFDVTPNPGPGIFNLTMQTKVQGKLQMTVYNAIGQMVHEFGASSAGTVQEVLDLSFLVNGQYQLKVVSGELWGVKRLVVVK